MNTPIAPAPVDRLIPAQTAFDMLGIRTTKAYAEVKAGKLKLTRNGRRSFVKASEINRYIAALDEAASHKEAA